MYHQLFEPIQNAERNERVYFFKFFLWKPAHSQNQLFPLDLTTQQLHVKHKMAMHDLKYKLVKWSFYG